MSDGELPGGYRSGVTRIGAGAVAGRIVLLWYGKGAACSPNWTPPSAWIQPTSQAPISPMRGYQPPPAWRCTCPSRTPQATTPPIVVP